MDLDPAILRQLAMGAIPPGVASLVLFALLWRRGTRKSGSRPILAALGLGLLYGAFHAWLFGLRFPPRESMDWLPLAAIAAAVGSCALACLPTGDHRPRWRPSIGGAVITIAVLGLVGWLAAGNLRKSWSAAETLENVGWFVLLTGLAWAGASVLAHRRPGPVAPLTLLIIAGGASQVLALAFSSLKFAQSAGIWAAFLGGAMVVAFFRRGLSLARGGVLPPVAVTAAAVFQAFLITSADRPRLYIGLLVLSAIGAGLGAAFPTTGGRGRRITGVLAPIVLAAIPVVIGVAVALAAAAGADDYEY